MLHGGYCVQRELLGTWSHNWSKHFFQPSGARSGARTSYDDFNSRMYTAKELCELHRWASPAS